MIKKIKTEKFEGIAVLIPNGAKNIGFHRSDWDMQAEDFSHVYYDINNESFEIDIVDEDHDYEIIGKATELTEEQCAEIVPKMKDSGYPFEIEDYKVTFENLMSSLGCDLNLTWLILKKLIN